MRAFHAKRLLRSPGLNEPRDRSFGDVCGLGGRPNRGASRHGDKDKLPPIPAKPTSLQHQRLVLLLIHRDGSALGLWVLDCRGEVAQLLKHPLLLCIHPRGGSSRHFRDTFTPPPPPQNARTPAVAGLLSEAPAGIEPAPGLRRRDDELFRLGERDATPVPTQQEVELAAEPVAEADCIAGLSGRGARFAGFRVARRPLD